MNMKYELARVLTRLGGRFIKILSLPKLVAERQNLIPATNFFAATKKKIHFITHNVAGICHRFCYQRLIWLIFFVTGKDPITEIGTW